MILELTYYESYASDRALRHALIEFLQATLDGFDIELFESLEFWDPTCTPFSFFDGPRCVANVAVFDLPLIVGGRALFAGGVQSVATHPAHRGRGLFRELMRRAIAHCDARYESLLLFTRIPSAYTPFGFRHVSDDVFVAGAWPIEGPFRSSRPVTADRDADIRLLDDLVTHRESVSDVLGIPGHRCLFFYNELRQRVARVRFVEELAAALVWDTHGETLRLLDVVARRVPSFALIAPYLPPAKSLEIWFTPDKLDVACDVRPRAFDDVLMVRGAWPIEQLAYGFPPTAYF